MKLDILFLTNVFFAQITAPNDNCFSEQWYLNMPSTSNRADIRVLDAWSITTGNANTKIALLEQSGNPNFWHDDLVGRIIPHNGNNSTADHATWVAGIMVANTNNDFGIAGINWNASLDTYVYNAVTPQEYGARLDNLLDGNYSIVNNSNNMGSGTNYEENVRSLKSKFEDIYINNTLFVNSMGNSGGGTSEYPAPFFSVIAVGASTKNNIRASYSNYGNHIEFLAPGGAGEGYADSENIVTTGYTTEYTYKFGTSFAAPIVSGIASLLLAKKETLHNDDLKNLLIQSCDKLPEMNGTEWTTKHGFGRVNAKKALDFLSAPYTMETETITKTSGTLVDDSHNHTFFNGNNINPSVPGGIYIDVKTYEISGHINFTKHYIEAPKVWVRDRDVIGWSIENPNNQLPNVFISNITATGFDYLTYVYWVGYDEVGTPINKYFPSYTTSLSAKIPFTVLGIPLAPELLLTPTTNNVGSVKVDTPISGSFTVTNTGGITLNLEIINYGFDLDSSTPNTWEHVLYKTLTPGSSTTINYAGTMLGLCDYGPFTESIIVRDNGNSIYKTHNIVGTLLLPDFCYGETQGKSASPEEQLFDGAFLGYFNFESDSIRFDKSKSILERLSFAYDLLKQPKTESVDKICKMIIELYPESEMGISFYAMGLLWEASLSKEAPNFNEIDLTSYLKELTERKEKYKIHGYAQLILSLLNVGNDIEGLKKLFSDYKYDGLKELALFHQFIHYYIYKQDKDTARKVSDQLDKMFVDSRYGYQAHLIFGDDGYTLEGLLELIKKKQSSLLAKRGESKTDILSEMPKEYKLFNNYPNPFNPTTTIKYSVPKVSNVKLRIYNMMGQLIKTLVNETKAPGFYNIEWNGTNENNSSVASGIYFYRFESGNFVANNKMILIK